MAGAGRALRSGVKVLLAALRSTVDSLRSAIRLCLNLDNLANIPRTKIKHRPTRLAEGRIRFPAESGGVLLTCEATTLPPPRSGKHSGEEGGGTFLESIMEICTETITLLNDLGTFDGFNLRSGLALERRLTAEEVANWDAEAQGEVEFCPSGDHKGVSLAFHGRSAVSWKDLVELDRLLFEIGNTAEPTFLRIYYATSLLGLEMEELTSRILDELNLKVFFGACLMEIREHAAFDLFQTYFSEQYAAWKKDEFGVLQFDCEAFLNSNFWSVEEVDMGERKALLVATF